jgi:hydroxymethylbilane synthase
MLAEAGLKRLGFAERITELLQPPEFLPAVGQGALGLETRLSDECRAIVAQLDDANTHAAVVAERAFLAALEGGCSAPIGALALIRSDGRLNLEGVWLSPDGRQRVSGMRSALSAEAAELGLRLADELRKAGARSLAHGANLI